MTVLGVQYGVKYTLTGPDGTKAVFNDDSDANYVGILTPDSSGLDSPDVREDSSDRIGADGATHGSFFYGRRPVVLQGNILATSQSDRNSKIDKILAASNALRADATLSWTALSGADVQLAVRRQQPVRITGAHLKAFQIPLVAADPRIYSATEHSTTSSTSSGTPGVHDLEVTVSNAGNAQAPVEITLNGALSNSFYVENETTTAKLQFLSGASIAAGHYWVLDSNSHTVLDDAGANKYTQLNLSSSVWFLLDPGSTKINVHGTMTSCNYTVKWRDAWV